MSAIPDRINRQRRVAAELYPDETVWVEKTPTQPAGGVG